jgi:hypothetical protein
MIIAALSYSPENASDSNGGVCARLPKRKGLQTLHLCELNVLKSCRLVICVLLGLLRWRGVRGRNSTTIVASFRPQDAIYPHIISSGRIPFP